MDPAIVRDFARRHPLQRFSSPSRGASAVLHTVSLASFAYSFSYLVLHPTRVNDSYGWHTQYLTIMGLLLATATFSVGLLADLTGDPFLFRAKNVLSVCSAPMECLITLLYWGLRAVDPQLVLPSWSPPMPLLTDLSFHLLPPLALVADFLLFSPPYSISFLGSLAMSELIAFAYWFWIERNYFYNEFYPYPIFEMLDVRERVGLFGFSAFVMAAATMALSALYAVVNGKDIKEEVKHLANGDIVSEGKRNGSVKHE